MTLALIAISIVAFAVLAMRQAPLWQWGVVFLAIGLVSRIGLVAGVHIRRGLAWAGADAAAGRCAAAAGGRRRCGSRWSARRPMAWSNRSCRACRAPSRKRSMRGRSAGMPSCSPGGRDWEQAARHPQADADGRGAGVPRRAGQERLLDDRRLGHRGTTAPTCRPRVWEFLKEKGFLGMLIGKEHGGLGFSAQAQVEVVSQGRQPRRWRRASR